MRAYLFINVIVNKFTSQFICFRETFERKLRRMEMAANLKLSEKNSKANHVFFKLEFFRRSSRGTCNVYFLKLRLESL